MDPFRGPVPDTYVLGSEFPRAEGGAHRGKERTAQARWDWTLDIARAPQTGWLKELWARGDHIP